MQPHILSFFSQLVLFLSCNRKTPKPQTGVKKIFSFYKNVFFFSHTYQTLCYGIMELTSFLFFKRQAWVNLNFSTPVTSHGCHTVGRIGIAGIFPIVPSCRSMVGGALQRNWEHLTSLAVVFKTLLLQSSRYCFCRSLSALFVGA